MKKLQGLLILIGVVQVVLGTAFLLAPAWILNWMGLSIPQTDQHYMLGMLAARFLAFGLGMFWIAREPEKHLFWIQAMILIQVIDLAVGLYYTAVGIIPWQTSAFPMFNATLFIILLWLWRPRPAARPHPQHV